ncbi:MAG: YecA family protein [Thermoanaerobaculia bacterium]
MIGRNDPCPCGSGKKYKKCHLADDAQPENGLALEKRPAGVSRWHDRDASLMRAMLDFRARHFADDPLILPTGPDDPLFVHFVAPWSFYVSPLRGRTLGDIYLEKKGRSLPREDRTLLEAQNRAWVSIWRIDAADADAGIVDLTDLLTGERRTVHEVSLSREMEGDMCILGRVVDLPGEAILGGSHSVASSREDAAEIADAFLEETGLERPVAPEELHKENAELLVELWDEAAGGEDEDGVTDDDDSDDDERIMATGIIVTIDPAARETVARRLGDIRGAVSDQGHFSFFERGGVFGLRRKLIAEAVFREDEVRVAVFSDGDPDAVAGWIDDAVGSAARESRRLEFRLSDLMPGMKAAMAFAESTLASDPLRPVTREDRLRRYTSWYDAPNDHLGGQSPRQAFNDPIYKAPLLLMLKAFSVVEEEVDPALAVDVDAAFSLDA